MFKKTCVADYNHMAVKCHGSLPKCEGITGKEWTKTHLNNIKAETYVKKNTNMLQPQMCGTVRLRV